VTGVQTCALPIYGYPGLASHQALHDALVKKVIEFERRFAAHDTRVTAELMTFLRDWLTFHIMKVDADYGRFLLAKGVR
jgi:hemerythrin